jgi:acyl dehydratase
LTSILEPGAELGPSRWIDVDAQRVERYASATEDSGWIAANRERAASGPFGTAIAHGFLTLSLLPELWFDVAGDAGYHVTVNYGVDRIRFPAPVPVGSRVRASFQVLAVEDVAGGVQARIAGTVERDGGDRPVCVAELRWRFLRAAPAAE